MAGEERMLTLSSARQMPPSHSIEVKPMGGRMKSTSVVRKWYKFRFVRATTSTCCLEMSVVVEKLKGAGLTIANVPAISPDLDFKIYNTAQRRSAGAKKVNAH